MKLYTHEYFAAKGQRCAICGSSLIRVEHPPVENDPQRPMGETFVQDVAIVSNYVGVWWRKWTDSTQSIH